MALQYGNQLAAQGKEAVQRELGRYVPVSRLRYYFAVDTRYVIKKLLLIMFPYTHKVKLFLIHAWDLITILTLTDKYL